MVAGARQLGRGKQGGPGWDGGQGWDGGSCLSWPGVQGDVHIPT